VVVAQVCRERRLGSRAKGGSTVPEKSDGGKGSEMERKRAM